jgi:hypothetical protein
MPVGTIKLLQSNSVMWGIGKKDDKKRGVQGRTCQTRDQIFHRLIAVRLDTPRHLN